MPSGLMGMARMNAMRNRALAAGGRGGINYNDGSLPPSPGSSPYGSGDGGLFGPFTPGMQEWNPSRAGGGGRGGGGTRGVFGLGYTAGMPVGSVNSRGAIFSGFMNGKPVFQAQSVAGNYGSAYSGGGMFGGGNFGVTRSNPVGFGIYPSGGMLTQKHL